MKDNPTLVCSDDELITNQPDVTTIDPASTCVCGEDIEPISKDRFNIKCLGVKDRKQRTEETWEFTCPKTGFTKSFTKKQNCKRHVKKAKKFLAKDCT